MLPKNAVETLDEARVWAEHRDELAELSEQGWTFARTGVRGFAARHGERRMFDSELDALLRRCKAGR